MLSRHLQKHRSCLSPSSPQSRTELAGGERTKGTHIPGAEIRVAHHHVHGFKCDVELFCQKLRERGHDALAVFDFAREASYPAIGTDAKVGVEIRRIRGRAWQ